MDSSSIMIRIDFKCIIKMFGNDYEMDFNEMNYKCI